MQSLMRMICAALMAVAARAARVNMAAQTSLSDTRGSTNLQPLSDPSSLIQAFAKQLDPFSIVLTIENKREVMDEYVTSWFGGVLNYAYSDEAFTNKVADQLTSMLPPALAENGIVCTLEKESVSGLTTQLKMSIQDYDVNELLTKAKGAEFVDAFNSLHDIFNNLGMPEKYSEIEGKIGYTLRQTFMVKVPTQIKENMVKKGIKSTVTTDPLPDPEEPPPQLADELAYELFFRVSIPDREPLASQIDKKVAKAAVRNMPQSKFLALVRSKLEDKVNEGIKDKVGEGLSLTVATESDNDAGSSSKTDSFWLLAKVHGIEVTELLRKTKGEAFAGNFTELFAALRTLNLPHSDITMGNMYNTIDKKVIGGLASTLPEKLSTALGATVTQVSKREYVSLQNAAQTGRCCATKKTIDHGVPEQLFWVSEDLARGAGVFGFGYGKEGHCPRVAASAQHKNGCVAKGYAQQHPLTGSDIDGKAVSTNYMSYTDCFAFGQAEDTLPYLTAWPTFEC